MLDRRPDRIPPSAPADDTNAGASTRSAGNACEVGEALLEGDAGHGRERGGGRRAPGIDSRTMRRSSGSDVRRPHTSAADGADREHDAERRRDDGDAEQARGQPQRGQGEHVAEGRHERGGHVVEVPAVADRARARAPAWPPSTTTEPSTPPTIEIVARSSSPIVPSSPSPTAIALATHGGDKRDADGEDAGGEHVLAEHGVAPGRQA